jgi:hypothetical protein
MANTEMLVQEQPLEAVVTEVNDVPNAELIYHRADGTIERALNPEDAIRRCPVLGKMPLEQANVLLELVAVGKEKLAAKNEAESDSRPDKDEPSQTTTEPIKLSKVTELKKVEKPADIPILEIAEPEPKEIPINVGIEPSPSIKPIVEIAKPVSVRPEYVQEEKISLEVSRALPTAENPATIIDKPIKVWRPEPELTSNQHDSGNKQEKITAVPITEASEITSISMKDLNTEPQPLAEGEVASQEMIPVADIAPTAPPSLEMTDGIVSPEPEILVSEEAVAVYEQLITISGQEDISEEQDLFAETDNPEVTTVEEIVVNDFEAWLDTPQLSKEPVTLEIAQDDIDGQPLEETLVQLVVYLKEVAEDQRADTIRESIQNLGEALAQVYAPLTEATERVQPMTPELTQRLLTLLKAVGYQNPGEALVAFVSRHDIEFLLQAIRYLSRLANADYRQEFLPPVLMARTPQATSEDILVQVGKRIFGLLMKRPEAIEAPLVV